jgi:hypothetical protein
VSVWRPQMRGFLANGHDISLAPFFTGLAAKLIFDGSR